MDSARGIPSSEDKKEAGSSAEVKFDLPPSFTRTYNERLFPERGITRTDDFYQEGFLKGQRAYILTIITAHLRRKELEQKTEKSLTIEKKKELKGIINDLKEENHLSNVKLGAQFLRDFEGSPNYILKLPSGEEQKLSAKDLLSIALSDIKDEEIPEALKATLENDKTKTADDAKKNIAQQIVEKYTGYNETKSSVGLSSDEALLLLTLQNFGPKKDAAHYLVQQNGPIRLLDEKFLLFLHMDNEWGYILSCQDNTLYSSVLVNTHTNTVEIEKENKNLKLTCKSKEPFYAQIIHLHHQKNDAYSISFLPKPTYLPKESYDTLFTNAKYILGLLEEPGIEIIIQKDIEKQKKEGMASPQPKDIYKLIYPLTLFLNDPGFRERFVRWQVKQEGEVQRKIKSFIQEAFTDTPEISNAYFKDTLKEVNKTNYKVFDCLNPQGNIRSWRSIMANFIGFPFPDVKYSDGKLRYAGLLLLGSLITLLSLPFTLIRGISKLLLELPLQYLANKCRPRTYGRELFQALASGVRYFFSFNPYKSYTEGGKLGAALSCFGILAAAVLFPWAVLATAGTAGIGAATLTGITLAEKSLHLGIVGGAIAGHIPIVSAHAAGVGLSLVDGLASGLTQSVAFKSSTADILAKAMIAHSEEDVAGSNNPTQPTATLKNLNPPDPAPSCTPAGIISTVTSPTPGPQESPTQTAVLGPETTGFILHPLPSSQPLSRPPPRPRS